MAINNNSIFTGIYPYVSVSTSQLTNYPPSNPYSGQLHIDNTTGITWVWNGASWQPANNGYQNSYNNTYNNIYNTVGATTVGGDITIFRDNGKVLSVKNTLERIMERLGMIEPDQDLIEKYPAVKAAYNDYEEEFAKAMAVKFPELQSSIRTYNMLVAIVKAEESNGNDI